MYSILQLRTTQIRAQYESTSCFIFLLDISKITKLMKKNLKKATVGISWEIWCSNKRGNTWRYLMKKLMTPGKTGRVGRFMTVSLHQCTVRVIYNQ